MARPKSNELTDRELAVMQVFWNEGEVTAEQVRQQLLSQGEDVAYVTIANVVRGLLEKGFLKQTVFDRPYRYVSQRSFEEVSKKLLGHFMGRLFGGSRQAMLTQLLDYRKLSNAERNLLQQVLENSDTKEGRKSK
ncbi:MAG: BlaI/MecI/CopY family transcriptional regulator [Pseudomonadota bacterium]